MSDDENKTNFKVILQIDACEADIVLENDSPELKSFATIHYPVLERALGEAFEKRERQGIDEDNEDDKDDSGSVLDDIESKENAKYGDDDKTSNRDILSKIEPLMKPLLAEGVYAFPRMFAETFAALLNNPEQQVPTAVNAKTKEWTYKKEPGDEDIGPGFAIYRHVRGERNRYATINVAIGYGSGEEGDADHLYPDIDSKLTAIHTIMPKFIKVVTHLSNLFSPEVLRWEYGKEAQPARPSGDESKPSSPSHAEPGG